LRTGFTPQEKKLSPVPHAKRFFEQEKAKKPSAYQTRQWHACTQLYKENSNPFSVSPCYPFTCYSFPCYIVQINVKKITFNHVQPFKWKLYIICVFRFKIKV